MPSNGLLFRLDHQLTAHLLVAAGRLDTTGSISACPARCSRKNSISENFRRLSTSDSSRKVGWNLDSNSEGGFFRWGSAGEGNNPSIWIYALGDPRIRVGLKATCGIWRLVG